ncbi:hypothetical protein BST61_g4190 [Cercospora zeina]
MAPTPKAVAAGLGAIILTAAVIKNCSSSRSTESSPLQKLPAEIIGMIATHSETDLHALRLTCKDLLHGSQDEWNARHMKYFRVALATRLIQHGNSLFAPAGRLGKVKKLLFDTPRERQIATSLSNEDQAMETFDLLSEFLRSCTTIQSVQVNYFVRHEFNGPLAHCPSVHLLRALRDIRPPTLKTFVLHTGTYPVSLVSSLLESMEISLRFLTIQSVNFSDEAADTLLALTRDRLHLHELHVGSWEHMVESKRKIAFTGQFAPRRRENKWMLDKLTNELEHYTMGLTWLAARGRHATKLAVNRFFQNDGSHLYDPGMTQESFGL